MNNVIYVTGNIIGESGHYVARSWVALADDSYRSRAIKVIEGDLVLTSEYDTIPYCEYAAQGGVCCLSNNIGCSEIPDFIYGRYLKEIDIFKKLSDLDKKFYLRCGVLPPPARGGCVRAPRGGRLR